MAGLCDVALVIGADTTPKGFFAPVGGERRNDPDWQHYRYRVLETIIPLRNVIWARPLLPS